ncbi:MAG: outer membrane protein assembly factor BamA [bacterium]
MEKSKGLHPLIRSLPLAAIVLMIFCIFSAASLKAQDATFPANKPITDSLKAQDEPSSLNKPITDLKIVSNDSTIVPQVRYLLGLQIKDLYSQERIDQGIERVKMLNVFSSIQVEKKVDLDGVRLTVTLKKNPVIEEIDISGNYPLFKNEVTKVISVRIGDCLDSERLQQSARDIEQLYRAEGYYQVQVSIHTEKNEKNQNAKVLFRIKRGWRTKVREVRFEEDGKQVKDTFAYQSILGIYAGNSLREVKLKKTIQQLESILVNQGFLKVKTRYQITHLPESYALLEIIIDKGQRVQVNIHGNRHISDKQLRNRITLFENRSHTEFDLQESVEDIRQTYLEQGFLFVEAAYEKKIKDKGEIQITFQIREGKKVFLDKVIFEGNQGISSKKLAGQILILQKITPFQRNVFNKLVYEEDLKAIKAFYTFEGYPWAEIVDGKTTFNSDQGRISKTVSIHEGPRVVVQRVSFQGNHLYDDALLREKVALKQGSYFTEEKWQEDRKNLAIFYSNHGYVFVSITPKVTFNKEKGLVALTYIIDEGPEAYFGKTIIRGNVRTRHSVIQDSLIFSEGDAFSYQEIIESNKNLSDLGIFRAVRVKPIGLEKQEKNTDILVEVEEMNTGRANVGVGFNSVQGYRGYLELREDNIAGTSLGTTLRLEYSGIGKQYNLSDGVQYARNISLGISDPLLMPKQKIEGSLNLFDTYEEKTGYDLRQNGVKIRLGRPLHKTIDLSLIYRLELARLRNEAPHSDPDDSFIPEEDREQTISSLKPVLSFDTRDSFFNPRKGVFTQVGFETAGNLLGGESSFSKLTISAAEFLPLSGKLILALETTSGYAWAPRHEKLPIQEGFYAGGLNSVRGYLEDSLCEPHEDVPSGGNVLLVNNLELRYDLYRQQLNGVLFFDAGNVWKTQKDINLPSVRTSAGLGLRIVTPVGPIRLDYAWVLGRKRNEPNGKFYISVGHMF